MKKVQWRERRTDGPGRTAGRGRGGRKTAEKAINLERFVCRARDRDSAAGESIVSFRPNCSAISGVFSCAISPLGGRSAVTKGKTGETQPGQTTVALALLHVERNETVQSVINIAWNNKQNKIGFLDLFLP